MVGGENNRNGGQEMKLYRKIKASERLPEKDTPYYCGINVEGLVFMGVGRYNAAHNFWEEYLSEGEYIINVDYWLEEIKITEEEIFNRIENHRVKCREEDGSTSYGHVLPSWHRELAKAILKKLEDKKCQ